MNTSRFKFPRRVRIHGGECGAVARALHHEAKIKSLPAVKEKVFFTTNERKSMSIKTAYKRIALVAVAALGMGLLSSGPSQAAYNATNSSMSCTAVGRVGVGIEFLVKSTGSIADGFDLNGSSYIQTQLTDAPAGAGIVAPEAAYASTGVMSSTSALRNDSITSNVVVAHNLGGYSRFLLAANDGDSYVAGTYSFLLWATTTAGAQPAKWASGNASCRVSVTLAGAPASFALTASSASADSSTVANTYLEATIKDAAGNPTLLTGTETFTVGANTGSAGAKQAFLSDTQGASALYTAAPGLGALGVMDSGTAAVTFDPGRLNVDLPVQHRNVIQAWVGASKAGTQAFVIKGSGPLLGLSSTFTLTTTSRPLVDRITPSGGTLFGGTRIDTGSLTVRDSSYGTLSNSMIGTAANAAIDPTAIALVSAASTTSKSVNFQLDLSTTGLVKGSVAAISTTTPVPSGVATGAFDFTSDTTSVVKSFTATAPNPGEGYVVTFNMGDNKLVKYQVSYVAQQLTSSIGSLSTNITSGARAATGSTVSLAVTAKDGFGTVISGATIRMTHNRTATGITSDVLTATTDASGVATFSVVDARTDFSATVVKNSTGTFTITGSTANSSTSAATSASIAYTAAANLTPGAITITETADDDDNVGNIVDAVINETITVTTDTGAVMAGVAYTATISDGLYERKTYSNPVSQLTGFTDANGYAFIRVAGYKSGVATVTFTVGTLTKSDTFTVVSAASKLRALSVDKATVDIPTGKTGYVTVTAKDIYGNVVPGASLTISYTGTSGRIVSYNGAQGNSATTNANGVVVVGIYGDLAGTGTLTAEYTSAVAATVTTTTQGVAPIARVASVSTAVTTSGTSAEQSAAEAASDAAAEAIDAANAATDAANLAAEAADAATVAAEEARDAADAATAAVEELATQVATLMAALKAQITTLANTVAKIAKKVKA
jgi:hypothetical protein